MFNHVRVGSNDIARSRAFYGKALGALGIRGQEIEGMLVYAADGDMYVVAPPREGKAFSGNGVTVGFKATSREAINKFHAEGLAHGGTCEGAPGARQVGGGIYAAYLRDPDGNKICALMPA